MSDLKNPDLGPFHMIQEYGMRGNSYETFNSYSEEERYQSFKERLIREVVTRERITHDCIQDIPLHDTTKGES